MKNIPDLQQVRFNKIVADGRIYVGLAGSNPIDNPVSVYTDYAGTNSVQTPIKLDYNSQAVIDGVVYSALYVDFAYSVQIVDADNVELFTPTYISSSTVSGSTGFDGNVFSSLSVALAASGQLGDIVTTAEYYANSGVGGATYKIVAGGTGTPDGGSYIDKTDGSGYQLEQVIGDKLRVDTFGTIGDGASDDEAPFQNALNALRAGQVFTGESESYYIASSLTVSNKEKFVIDFNNATINLNPDADMRLFEFNTCSSFEVKNIYVDGHIDENNTYRQSFIWLTSSGKCKIYNNEIRDCLYGVINTDDECNNVTVKGNIFQGSVAYDEGTNIRQLAATLVYNFAIARRWIITDNIAIQSNHLVLCSKGYDCLVSNNEVYLTNDSGIYMFNTGHVVSGNNISYAGKDGIKIIDNVSPGTGDRNVISNNVINVTGLVKEDGGVCIISEGSNCVISNNTCISGDITLGTASGLTGIFVNGSNSIVDANVCKAFSNSTIGGGITVVTDISSDGVVVSNNIVTNQKQGVTAGQTGTNTLNGLVIKGNKFEGCGTAALLTSVDKTKFNKPQVVDNIFDGNDNCIATFASSNGIVDAIYKGNSMTNTVSVAFRLNGTLDNLMLIGNYTDGSEATLYNGDELLYLILDSFVATVKQPNNIIGREQTIEIDNDAVYTFTPVSYETAFTIEIVEALAVAAGKAITETGGGNTSTQIWAHGSFAVLSNTVLTGTTGTVGNLTYSSNLGTQYIENRTGAKRKFTYTIIGHS